jgi:hypothetical protein
VAHEAAVADHSLALATLTQERFQRVKPAKTGGRILMAGDFIYNLRNSYTLEIIRFDDDLSPSNLPILDLGFQR